MTSTKMEMEDDLKKLRWPQKKKKQKKHDLKKKKKEKKEDDLKKEEEKRRPKKQWNTDQSTKINLIGCDTIVNSPSYTYMQSLGTAQPLCNFFLSFCWHIQAENLYYKYYIYIN
jgi:hypothetical protein